MFRSFLVLVFAIIILWQQKNTNGQIGQSIKGMLKMDDNKVYCTHSYSFEGRIDLNRR